MKYVWAEIVVHFQLYCVKKLLKFSTNWNQKIEGFTLDSDISPRLEQVADRNSGEGRGFVVVEINLA